MAGRPKIFDKEAVVQKATEVFWAKGYEAASTEELLAAMGIGKGSFYLAFEGGKKELFEKALDQFSNRALEQFRRDLAASSDPVELIRKFFRGIAFTPEEVHMHGCFLGNTLAELSGIDPELKDRAARLLQQLEQLFLDVIQQAQAKGSLQTEEHPALLARHLINLWNGLNITRRMYPDAAALKPLIELQLQILH